jgi:hypothetical protein
MAGLVPIEFECAIVLLDTCLIDDDPLVEMVWNAIANEKGKSFRHFFNAGEPPEDFPSMPRFMILLTIAALNSFEYF